MRLFARINILNQWAHLHHAREEVDKGEGVKWSDRLGAAQKY